MKVRKAAYQRWSCIELGCGGDPSYSPLVAAMVVLEACDGRWCQAQRCSAIFSVLSCRSLRDLYFNLYDMNETRITMQKKTLSYYESSLTQKVMFLCGANPLGFSSRLDTRAHIFR